MIPNHHFVLLTRPYGLVPSDLEFLRSSQNHVFLSRREDGMSILRVSKGRHRTGADVKAELAWVDFLAGRGMNVCKPIPTLDGEDCVSLCIEGEDHVVTRFEHAPGRKIIPEDIAPPIYEKLGGVLAELHRHTLHLPADHAAQARPHWHESRLLRQDVAELRERLPPAFVKSLADLMGRLRKLPVTPQTYGLVHADACLGNCFLDDDQLWIFDFDNCEHGHFVQDFATILYDSIYCRMLNEFADEGMNDRITPLWAGLWRGYAKAGPLAAVDAFQLKHFFLLREAMIYIHYHRTLDVPALSESFKAGLEVMRRNVEEQSHQVDFERLAALSCTVS